MGLVDKEQYRGIKQTGFNHPLELGLAPFAKLMTTGLNESEALELVEKTHPASSCLRGTQIIRRGLSRGIISTGSSFLNNILGGGVRMGLVTDFFGESGSGKTQITFQLCLNAALPKDQGGLGAESLFIDTTGTFRPERIAEMAQNRGLEPYRVLEKILTAEVGTLREQLDLPYKVKELLTTRKLGLMIIDTLTENFLETYGGDEGLIRRQSLLGRHLHDLALSAIYNDIAIVLTNTVRAGIGETLVEIGGNTLAQGVHRRVHLAFAGGRRMARLIPSFFEPSEVYYRIGEIGVTD